MRVCIIYIYIYTLFNRSAHSAGPSHLYDLSGVLGWDLFRAFAWNGSPPNIHIGWGVGWGSVPRFCVERIPTQLGRVSGGSLSWGALFTPLSFCHTSAVIMTFLKKNVCGTYGKQYFVFGILT